MAYPYSKQTITNEDVQKVSKVLKSKLITQGPVVKKFEKSIANFVGAKYASATNSATSALHVSCLALDLKKGDYVWTVPNSFVASANCAVYCGAKVDFVDIDENDLNMHNSTYPRRVFGRSPKFPLQSKNTVAQKI